MTRDERHSLSSLNSYMTHEVSVPTRGYILLHAEEPKHPLLRYQNIDIRITTLVFKLGILSAPAAPSTPHCYHATCLQCSNFSPQQRAKMLRMRIREVSHSHNRQNRTSTERCSRLGEQGQDVASRHLRDCSLGRFCRRPCGVRKKVSMIE